MKTFIFYLIFLLTLPAIILAQFNGNIGRGDIVNGISSSILNGDIIIVSGSTGADGYYPSLTNAVGAFNAINAGSQTGKTIVVLIWGSSTSETGTHSLNAGAWSTLTIYPKITGLIVSGGGGGPYITLNGADNVTIDGRLNGSGVTKTLTISKIQFINSAVNDIIKYCSIAGDFSVSGTSSATLDGETTVGGNLKIEGGSNLSTTPASDLTISGTLTIRP